MRREERPSDQVALAAGALAPLLAGAALVSLRGVVPNTTIALAMVVLVVAAGALGGRKAGAAAAVTAALGFNFFHTKPYLSVRIASADDLETMTLLLVIGLLVGQVAAVSRRRENEARHGQEEVERVWLVAELAVSGAAADELLGAVETELRGLLRLEECVWRPRPEPPNLPVLQPTATFEPLGVHRFADGAFELPREGFDIPVRARAAVLGHFRCLPTPGAGIGIDRRRTALALAATVGLALSAGRSPAAPANEGPLP